MQWEGAEGMRDVVMEVGCNGLVVEGVVIAVRGLIDAAEISARSMSTLQFDIRAGGNKR